MEKVNDEFKNRPLDYFYDKIVNENKEIYDIYNSHYITIRDNHPVFRKGWQGNFFDPIRYMNWIIYAFIIENFSKRKTIFDIGCYDGVLVKVLYNQGYNAYGWNYNGYTAEELDWDEMYQHLDIRNRIQTKFNERVDIVIMFDFHHNFKPEDLIPFIKRRCSGDLPETIFFDRDYRTGMFNKLYYNDGVLNELNITEIVKFPKCGPREWMIWRKNEN